MSRKTIDVASVRQSVNYYLAMSCDSKDCRLGNCNLLEEILYLTGNFKGFRYLNDTEVPSDALPGINKNVEEEDKFKNTDETRRFYF